MCELYVKADPILYESRSRSLRIRGVVTTLRLENQFWQILQEIAEVDGMTTNQLITKLYEEIMELRGEVENFAFVPARQLHSLSGSARGSPGALVGCACIGRLIIPPERNAGLFVDNCHR